MNADVYVAARIASSLRDGHASEGTQLLAYALWRLARAISTEDAVGCSYQGYRLA